MNRLFCPKCGNPTDIFYDNVCRECFVKNKKLMHLPMVVHAKICPTCGSFFRKGRWEFKENEKEVIVDYVKDSLQIDRKAEKLQLKFHTQKSDHYYMVRVSARAEINGIEIKQCCDTEVRVDLESCDTCSRIAGGYFEGIVQIRADKRIPSHEELEKCKSIAYDVAEKLKEKGNRLAFISKTVKLSEGIDLYVGEAKLGKQICKAIANALGGEFTQSPKLVGRKDGVEVYRITFALRLPEFMRGDIISIGDKVVEVISLKKHIKGVDLDTGKRFVEKYDHLMHAKKLGSRGDAISAVLVSDEGNTIQVLDPYTYETVTLKKPGFIKAKAGEQIKVIKTKKGLYVLP